MEKDQADVAAEALLGTQRERQELELGRKRAAEKSAQTQRKRGAWWVAGLFVGAAIGYAIDGTLWPAPLIGLGAGALAGVLFVR